MVNSELIKSAMLALLPDGELWKIAPEEDFDLLFEAISENWAYIAGFMADLGYVRDPERTPNLEELEREFGNLPDESLSEILRRQQLAAIKYDKTDHRSSDDDLQNFLVKAGFDVQVHSNDPSVDPSLFPGDILLNGQLYFTTPAYLMQCGGSIAFCGHSDAVCGRFNNFNFESFDYELSTDPDDWPFIFFVGGDATRDGSGALTSIAPADIPLNRKSKFIELILKTKPLFDTAVLIINYV